VAARVKVIDLAKELGVTSKDLIVALEGMGHKGMRAMSPLLAATANELRVKLGRGRELPAEPKPKPADDPMIVATMQAIEERLTIKTSVGGVARYENDYYHQVSQDIEKVPGNPWFICTLWLAQWHIARAQTLRELQATVSTLQWVAQHGLRSGVLAEQVDPYTDAPLSVSPLTWSHAEVLITVHDYVEKYKELVGQTLKPAEATVTG